LVLLEEPFQSVAYCT